MSNTHFRIREHTSDNSHGFQFSSRQGVEVTAKLFYSPLHNCVPHTLWHDLPCRRTTWKSPLFPRLVVFPMLLAENFGFKHGSVMSLLMSHCLWVPPPLLPSPPPRQVYVRGTIPRSTSLLSISNWTKILLLSSQFDVISINCFTLFLCTDRQETREQPFPDCQVNAKEEKAERANEDEKKKEGGSIAGRRGQGEEGS